MRLKLTLLAGSLILALALATWVGAQLGNDGPTVVTVPASGQINTEPLRSTCERLAQWRDSILAETHRPPVHRGLAEEAYSMACGPL